MLCLICVLASLFVCACWVVFGGVCCWFKPCLFWNVCVVISGCLSLFLFAFRIHLLFDRFCLSLLVFVSSVCLFGFP